MIVHLVDGTYELFRCFYGTVKAKQHEQPYSAVRLVLHAMLELIETGGTHIGIATDHIIESFRNKLWPGYKTGAGIDPLLWRQFHPLEEALAAFGFTVWPMVELEADDALASAAHLAKQDLRVEKVCIWTPDKDLAQCVDGTRVVQVDRRGGKIRDHDGVVEKFGVPPALIPDYLALVGDSADGYPGIRTWGPKRTAAALTRHQHIENIPELAEQRDLALLFRDLATLRVNAPLFESVDELRYQGPRAEADDIAERMDAGRLLARAQRLARAGA